MCGNSKLLFDEWTFAHSRAVTSELLLLSQRLQGKPISAQAEQHLASLKETADRLLIRAGLEHSMETGTPWHRAWAGSGPNSASCEAAT